MNNEPELNKSETKPRSRRVLDERLASRPAMLDRLHQIVDTLEQSLSAGCDAHLAEERVIEELRKLGQVTLTQWAEEANEQAQAAVPTTHPQASKNGKKNA